MASKYQLVSSKFYYEDSDVPRNKFNIKDTQTIHEIEKELLEEAYAIFFNELNEDTRFDKNILFHSTKEHLNHSMIGLDYTEILTWQKANLDFVRENL
jgi:hypothetical protein